MKTPMHLLLAKIWIHKPHHYIFEIADGIGLRWYGLAYVLGFLGGAWLLTRYAKATPPRSLLPAEKVWDLIIALVLGVFIGARLGYFIFYRPGDLVQNPLVFFRVWEGGMASHGGFIGVVLALVWFARHNKIPFLHIGDLVATIASLGLMLGRIANYLNGELWGKLTDGTWGVVFAATDGGPHPRHPSQLYEAALEGALLLAFVQWRFWRTDVARKQPGRLGGEFLALYAVARCVCEYFREPDAALIWGLSRGTFYSIFLFAAGLALVVYATRKAKEIPAKKSKR
ncbi:prolipoprotein diacylglyceryl transferase [Ereboglobus luteus]|nr:prolipoprotein diacylglyceryl transferase [Ereboglobus luteus]